MQLSLEFSDPSPFKQLTPGYLKRALMAALYHADKVSSRQACGVLGLSRREFEEMLPEFGVSVLADDDSAIDIERLR